MDKKLEQLVEQITNKFNYSSFKEDLPEWKIKNSISRSYLYKDLNQKLKDILKDLNLPQYIIQIPNIPNVDWTIDIKSIFELNRDKFENIKQAAEFIYKKLNENLPDIVSNIEIKWIFVNIYLSENTIYKIVEDILESNIYWEDNILRNQKVIVDYSSPNIAKQMSIWHFRATIQWQVISNLLEYLWWNVLRWNYIWDRWTPFWKLIYSFLILYYDWNKLPKELQYQASNDIGLWEKLLKNLYDKPIDTLWKIYAFFKLIPFEDKEERARYYFKLLSEGDKNIRKLWEIFRFLSLKEFEEVYDRLNIKFDVILWESFAEKYVDKVINDLKSKGYLAQSKGAYVVFFKKYWNDEYKPILFNQVSNFDEKDLEVLLIKKQDWTTLYATRDLASLYIRWKILWADKIYYVVWKEQSLHFKLVFSLADSLWYIKAKNLFHVAFWLLLVDWKKMSSRKGDIVKIVDLINAVVNKISENFSDRVSKEDIEKLAISAIIINDLKNDRIKDVNFDLDKMTRLDWDSWVYIQYWWVRLNSLINNLEKSLENFQDDINDLNIDLLSDFEKSIIKKISYYPFVLKNSIDILKPNLVVSYLFDIVKTFNSWYSNTEKILSLSVEERKNKLKFLKILRKVFYSIFVILNLPFVEKM